MSTLTHGQRAVSGSRKQRTNAPRSGVRRPYFVLNGAIMVSIAAIAITLIGILYLIQTSQVAQLGYDMTHLQDRSDSLTMEISELEYELARYQSLQTVEDVATEQLGMTQMTTYHFLEVQQPARQELELPKQEQFDSPTFVERIQHAVLGIGTANSRTSQQSSQRSDEEAR